MAHHGGRGARALAALGAAALACTAQDVLALTLGEAQVRSALGEPLDLRIPVTLAAGESIEPSCFSFFPGAGPGISRVGSGRISVQRSAAGTQLRVQTTTPVEEPAVAVGIAAACRGLGAEVRRDYSLLLDLPAGGRAAPVQKSAVVAQGEPPSLRAIAATLIARIGDTLESIANAIFPHNRAAKNSYIEALRDTNPTLSALGDSDPIPVETPVALPDLRTFARTHPLRPAQPTSTAGTQRSTADLPPAKTGIQASRPRREPRAASQAVEPHRPAPRLAAPAPSSSPGVPAARRDGGFVLRLSSPEVDLSRSRAIDDRMRSQLRERQMILDQDDQVAALLALRHSVKQLETKVAELQLKLSGMPTSFPPPRTSVETPKPIEPPKVAVAPPSIEPPKVAVAPPPKVEPAPAPKIEAPAPAKVEAAPPKIETPPARVEPVPKIEAPSPARVEAAPPPAQTAAAKAEERPVPLSRRTVSESEWLEYALWVLAVLLLFGAGYLTWRLWRRHRAEAMYEAEAQEAGPGSPPEPADDRIVVADEHIAEPDLAAAPAPQPEYTKDGRRIIDADVELPTRLGNDSEDLRRRYIEERFPEITKGAINLDDAASIVKGARLFYEDGAIGRAVELLQFAIERNPSEVRPWLALFEIFRVERLTGEFAALAQRFKDAHGASPYWPKVQYFGREIDPANALYQQAPIDKFQTIGPAQARRIAADNFDPIAENWLGAPMDFENEVLANDLRKAVMAEAGITEGDLLPNPMPALRNVEMFTVA